jgi:hypothetical protein
MMTTPPRSQQQLQQQHFYLQPPSYLNDLAIGESIHIDNGDNVIRIVKVANEPPLFHLPEFLASSDCDALMSTAAVKSSLCWQDAETKQGRVEHRTGSRVVWLGDYDDDDDADDDDHHNWSHGRHHHYQEESTAASVLAGYLQHLTAHLFLPHVLVPPYSVDSERLQVVQYVTRGKYDLHHDGFDRTVTVLTYLNGIAGTWFPFVRTATTTTDSSSADDDCNDIPTMQLGNENMLNGRVPGRDGICFVGSEGMPAPTSNHHQHHNHLPAVVWIEAMPFAFITINRMLLILTTTTMNGTELS